MKKVLTLALCVLFAGFVAAAPAKKPAEPVVVAEKQATTEEKEKDCTKEATEELKAKCEAEKAAKEEEKKPK